MKTNQGKRKQDQSKFIWKPGEVVITKKPKKKGNKPEETKKEKKPATQ